MLQSSFTQQPFTLAPFSFEMLSDNFSVLIVGRRAVGKTTLMKKIYNEKLSDKQGALVTYTNESGKPYFSNFDNVKVFSSRPAIMEV